MLQAVAWSHQRPAGCRQDQHWDHQQDSYVSSHGEEGEKVIKKEGQSLETLKRSGRPRSAHTLEIVEKSKREDFKASQDKHHQAVRGVGHQPEVWGEVGEGRLEMQVTQDQRGTKCQNQRRQKNRTHDETSQLDKKQQPQQQSANFLLWKTVCHQHKISQTE